MTQQEELALLRAHQSVTRRVTVPALEEILYEPYLVLDHGFVRVIDYMGNDQAVVQAARVSYGKGTKKSNEDRGLIYYLMRHQHTTPFEMCEIKFHIKLPIFVARQWIRHRTANVNEYSARYSVLDKEFYVPSIDQLAPQSSLNHQGRSDHAVSPEEAESLLALFKQDAERCYAHYSEMLNYDETGNPLDSSKKGLARELARMNLPLNYYTEWYWKIDLHNLLRFLALRADSHAQYEIRVYAETILNIVKQWVPLTYAAFLTYCLNSHSLTEEAVDVIRAMIQGKNPTMESSGLSKREWNELMILLKENVSNN